MKLFIGSLSYDVTEEELRNFFEEHVGNVESARVVLDRDTGRSRGFGFVEFANDEDGKKAIQELNGVKIKGREIVVKQAIEKERREGGAGGRSFRPRGERERQRY